MKLIANCKDCGWRGNPAKGHRCAGCCALGCDKTAEWMILGPSSRLDDITDACTTHVGELLADGVQTVHPWQSL